MAETFPERLSRAAKNLLLALLNATLLLIVLALFFAWRVAGTVERVAENTVAAASAQVAQLAPLKNQVESIETQLMGLRADIAGLSLLEDSDAAIAVDAMLAELNSLEALVSEVNNTFSPIVETVTTDPGAVAQQAVAAGFAALGDEIATLGLCAAPGTS